jgi:hypothetical protein
MSGDERRTYNRLYMREWRRENPTRVKLLYRKYYEARQRQKIELRRCFGCGRALRKLHIVERLVIAERGFTRARKLWCGEC